MRRSTAPALPRSRAGWCSWYYYGRAITPEEMLVNARWFADHMREYGLTLILLDDGWQGRGRDWTELRETFPRGMQWLAGEIRGLGLLPGIWLCPQGQDNVQVVRDAGCFLLNPDGSSITGYFGGPYTVDPTHPVASEYVRRLAEVITQDWGYRYLKTDGLPDLLHAYRRHHARFFDPSVSPEDAARRSFQALREGAGEDVFLAGCSGLPLEVAGIYNAQRTGADVDAEWRAFSNAIEATMQGYYLHNIVWFSDPDCCLLRPPLTYDMARAWATLMALTGQLLLFSDRMPDLGHERVELIKRIAPVAPIRPFDLFPSLRHKRIFDLKVNRLGRAYDVVGIFNYDERQAGVEWLRFADLGLPAGQRYFVYDFWASELLGSYTEGIFVEVPAAGCRVITLMAEGEFPVLLSTNRHVVQGWPDVAKYAVDADDGVIAGRSRVIEGEHYVLTFGLPASDEVNFQVESVAVAGVTAPDIAQGRMEARVAWTPQQSGFIDWQVRFTRIPAVHPLAGHQSYPYMTGVRDLDPWTVELYWVSFGSPAAFSVRQDGKLLGYVFGNRCRVSGLDYGSRHLFEIGVADQDGCQTERTGRIEVQVGETLPAALYLSDLPWQSATSGYLSAKADRSVGGASLSTGGKRYAKGVGTHPSSRIVYELQGIFTRLTGAVGMEDQNGLPPQVPPEQSGQAVFRILADGREILAPVPMLLANPPSHSPSTYAASTCWNCSLNIPSRRPTPSLRTRTGWNCK